MWLEATRGAAVGCVLVAMGCSGARTDETARTPAEEPVRTAQPPPARPVAAAADATRSLPGGSSYGPTTEAVTMQELAEMAGQLPENAVGYRIALGDVAYPRNEEENRAMGGFALLLVTAVTRNPEELPLHRVVLRSSAGDMDLPRAGRKPAIVTDARVRSAYGDVRVDDLYYLPVFATRVSTTVDVDFAKNRTGLEILRFPSSVPLPAGVTVITEVQNPQMKAVEKLADEELAWSSRGGR